MWLLVGGDSEIGTATHRALTARGQKAAATTRRADRLASDRPFLDLAASLATWEPPPDTQAACIFAAIARLAACADDPAGSAYVNVTQTLALADRLLARGVYVLFLSTNQVFDGKTPHVSATARPSPVSEYGRQKARAEAFFRERMATGAPVAILRLAKVVSPDMALIRDWIAALSAGKPVRGFRDMTLAPAPTSLVTAAIASLMEERRPGIFQLTGPRDVPYAEVARFIAGYLGADPALVTEMSALEAGLPQGATPLHTTLDSSLLRERYGLIVPEPLAVIDTVIKHVEAQIRAS